MLFQAYRTTEHPDDENISNELYGDNKDKNAFYRLKNRLLDEVLKSQLLLHFRDNPAFTASNYFALARLYESRSQFALVVPLLRKAEKLGIEAEDFQVLDGIYAAWVRLSVESVLGINPEKMLEKRRRNFRQLEQLRLLDDALALASYRLQRGQLYDPNPQVLQETMAGIIAAVSSDSDLSKSATFRIKLYEAFSKLLLQQQDYQTLESYLLVTYKDFTAEGILLKAPAETSLQLLTYLANTLNKNGKYELSLAYAERLRQELELKPSELANKYITYYYNVLLNNYSETDLDKALYTLHEMAQQDVIINDALKRVYVFSNQVIVLFHMGDYKRAMQMLLRTTMDDAFQSLNKHLRLQLEIAEPVLRLELDEPDMAVRAIERLRRDYQEILSEHTAEQQMLVAIKRLLDGKAIRSELLNVATSLQNTLQQGNTLKLGQWFEARAQTLPVQTLAKRRTKRSSKI